MNILLVIDQYDGTNNGTTVSARRFADALKRDGNEVTILTTGEIADNKIVVKKYKMPAIVRHFLNGNDMVLAKPNRKIMYNAFKGKDIIHFYMPFKLSRDGLKIAKKMHIPHTAAFHVQPENITYPIGLGKNKFANEILYKYFRKFYNEFRHIHCPSEFIANQLKANGYKAKLHIISNGVGTEYIYRRVQKPKEFEGKIIVTMVGRYAREKRQDLLIKAVSKSKYSDRIQLILAGKGLEYNTYAKLSKELKLKPIMKFYTKEELINVLNYTDIYVHAADAEIEAISCLEAIACGNVPIISNSSESATKQFAIDERSLFEHGNENDLANKIDYWIENKIELEKMQNIYAKSAEKYRIDNSIKLIEEMFREEIDEYNKSKMSK